MFRRSCLFRAILFYPALLLFVSSCGTDDKKSSTSGSPVFKKISSAESGINFRNIVDENINNYFDLFAYVYNGGGVAIGDINEDGLADIYFTGNEVSNKLYLNEGNLRFRDITESAGVGGNGKWNNGVTMADVNADGLLDIYVCKGGWHDPEDQRKNLLFINQGDLTFKEQAAEFGLAEPNYSIHASFFDMDNDNDLDVYITNRPDSFDLPLTEMIRQKKLSPATSRHKLYKNENGKFTDVGLSAGITNTFGYALSVVTSDLNNDGYTDIFVANDFAESDYMYINQGDGTFKEKIKEATNHISMYSMGTDVADINNDGLEDIMVSEMLPEDYTRSKVSMPSMDVEGFNELVKNGMHRQYMHNALHLNQGNLFFSEISQFSGVAKTEWSWSCLLSDFDNDGNRDLFVANGYKRDVFDGDLQQKLAAFVRQNRDKYSSPEELFRKGFKEFINVYDPIKVTDYLFRNKGDLRFENVSAAWGITEPSFSNGAAAGDLDNDGDLDLVINNLDDEAFVYENKSSEWNNYLKISLTGPSGNKNGIGAKVSIYSNGQLQYFENKTVRGYLSSSDPIIHFGVGQAESIDSVIVKWKDGLENTVKDLKSNQQIEIPYDQKTGRRNKPTIKNTLMAEATSDLLPAAFVHRENTVNEYKDQVLLPHIFSRSGPFMAVADVNGDGLEDFYVGGAAGQAGNLFLQKGGRLEKKDVPVFEKHKMVEAMGSVFFDKDKDGDLDLYVVSGGSEFAQGSDKYNDRIYENDGKGNFTEGAIIATVSSGSCVAPYDIDGDGDLDLFRGGQVVAGTYPKVPKSYLLLNENGKFVDKTSDIAPILNEPGMVNSAMWVDLNGDKNAELVVAGEWMPLRIFAYDGQKMKEVTPDYGLEKTEGWWNTLVADDLDGDGDQDMIAGNLGENYKFSASAERPFQVYAKDFDANGTNDVFLARYYKDTRLVPIRGRECTSQQMPVISEKFPTYHSFATSDLSAILGEGMANAMHYQAHLFSTVMLINEDGKLTIKRLPTEAQLSAVNGIIVKDLDADGKKDILLAGNKFDVEVETTAADASPGLFLKGTGNLNFKPLTISESGFFVPYNVKDLKAIQIGDKWAVVVGVNNEKLRIFTTGRTGSAGTLAAVRK
jgi:enediyne biosynthesis protein E4